MFIVFQCQIAAIVVARRKDNMAHAQHLSIVTRQKAHVRLACSTLVLAIRSRNYAGIRELSALGKRVQNRKRRWRELIEIFVEFRAIAFPLAAQFIPAAIGQGHSFELHPKNSQLRCRAIMPASARCERFHTTPGFRPTKRRAYGAKHTRRNPQGTRCGGQP